MLTKDSIAAVVGVNAFASGGEKAGSVAQILLGDDDEIGWIVLIRGLFGSDETYVPADRATFFDGQLRLGVTIAQLDGAPKTNLDEHLGPQARGDLRRHYGFSDNRPAEA